MPSLWSWPLATADDLDRRAVHALLSEWLDIDHHAKSKPWSWSAHPGELRIGLLDDGLVERLLDRAEAYRRSRTHRAGVTPVAAARQIAAASWGLIADLRPGLAWTLEFTSPVTFRRGQRFVPWPAPSSVFGSLRATWRTFAAPHVGDLELDLALDPVIVTSVRGHSVTERVALRDRRSATRATLQVPVDGFLGNVTYTIDGTVDPAAVSSLARLAPFCGVGAYTTRGFGAVRALATG